MGKFVKKGDKLKADKPCPICGKMVKNVGSHKRASHSKERPIETPQSPETPKEPETMTEPLTLSLNFKQETPTSIDTVALNKPPETPSTAPSPETAKETEHKTVEGEFTQKTGEILGSMPFNLASVFVHPCFKLTQDEATELGNAVAYVWNKRVGKTENDDYIRLAICLGGIVAIKIAIWQTIVAKEKQEQQAKEQLTEQLTEQPKIEGVIDEPKR